MVQTPAETDTGFRLEDVSAPHTSSVRVGILGAAEARLSGAVVDLGTRKQRALLTALAMHRGHPVLPDTIVDLLWGDAPPTAVNAALQGYVARLRRALEPDRPPRAPSEVLVTQQAGYALVLLEGSLDAWRFEASVTVAHRRLGAGVTPDGPGPAELESLFADLSSALGLWRGLPYTELEDAPAAQAERSRLEELRAIALEQARPLVGRDAQLSALVGLLEQSEEQTVFAVVTGDPGIGKSRLCAELAAVAASEGTTVLVGRCSQDEGAPPLHPWARVLSDLGRELPSGAGTEDETSGFRAWEAIAAAVLDAAGDRPLLVILDDLHWADTSTLRVLRLLAEPADSGRLMVVPTWRHRPAPTGQLAEVAEALARRHALRLELGGLSVEGAGEIVTSVAETPATAIEAEALRTRTDGHPFFLVEYALLARDGGDLAALLAEENPPAAVNEVLTRRIATLPVSTAKVLRTAGVLGRQFDVPTLAVALGADQDDVLDDLDAALKAGLVREDGVDQMRFAHALVRDTVYAGLSRSRRGRMHARAAGVLSA